MSIPVLINARPDITSDALLRVGLSGKAVRDPNINTVKTGGTSHPTSQKSVNPTYSAPNGGTNGTTNNKVNGVTDEAFNARVEKTGFNPKEDLPNEDIQKRNDWRATLITMSIIVLIIVVILILMYFIKERDAARAAEEAEKLKKEEESKTEEAKQQAEKERLIQEEERRREMFRKAQENERMMAIINNAALGGSSEIADNIDANIVSRNQYHNRQVAIAAAQNNKSQTTDIHETEASESDGKEYSSDSSDNESVSSPPPQTSVKSWRDYSEVEQRNIIKEIVAVGKNRAPIKAKYGLNNYHIGMIIKKNNDYYKKLSASK